MMPFSRAMQRLLAMMVVIAINMVATSHVIQASASDQSARRTSPRGSASSNKSSIAISSGGANPNRDMRALESWAKDKGVLMRKGTVLSKTEGGEWSVSATAGGSAGQTVLMVPSSLVISSTDVRKETEIFDRVGPAVDHLTDKKCEGQINQFLLWIRILRETEKKEASQWHPWLSSLPRTFRNAINMDDVELECLPPFAWSLAKIKIMHLTEFMEALKLTTGILSQETREDEALLRWAFNMVFTRCWGQDGDEVDRKDIVPMGDMFNHEHPGNVFINYDDERNLEMILKEDVLPGDSLSLSYGFETNPYRFMVVFGFVDESQETVFSQLMAANPTEKHVELGYDVSKMTFDARDGSFTEELWDFVLYNLLEQVPDIQDTFYQAHVSENQGMKDSIRRRFYMETCIMLKKHVDKTLAELYELVQTIDQHNAEEHNLLPMIRRNNVFVAQIFQKAKHNIDQMIKQELLARKELEKEQEAQQTSEL